MLRSQIPTRLLALFVMGLLTACATGGGMEVESDDTDRGDEEVRRIPAGTEFEAELQRRLSVEEAEEGDSFHATVSEAVTRNGRTLVPEGALIHGRVTAVQQADDEGRPNVLKLAFDRIEIDGRSYPLNVELTEANPKSRSGEMLKKVGAGTALGAVVGGVIGGDLEGVLIGAGIGAAAGTAVALGTQEEEGVLERGSEIRLVSREAIALDTDG